MSWSYVGQTSQSGANRTFTLPATAVAGDLLVYAGSMAQTVVLPGDWTEVPIASSNGGLALWWKSAVGGETSIVTTGGSSSSPATRAVMLMYRGLLPDTPLDVTSVEKTVTGATSIQTNALTTTEPNELVILVAADNTSSVANGSMTFGASGATASVSRYSNGYDSNFSRAINVVEASRATVGNIYAIFYTAAASASMAAISVSFKAAPSNGSLFFGSNF